MKTKVIHAILVIFAVDSLLFIMVACTNNKDSRLYNSRETDIDDVWICLGTSSHTFHSSYKCKGIKACKGEKKQISLEEAFSMGRTPCHFCCDEDIYKNPHDPDTYDPMNDENNY